MACCPPRGAEPFTVKAANRDARRFRRRGLDGTAERLVAAIAPENRTILEVGGGVGCIQIELLRRGAEHATNVELSPAYESAATELLGEAGLSGRVDRRVLDFVRDAELVAPADIVLLNKVVCCSPDLEGLVGGAARHTRRELTLSFPRDTWWIRLGMKAVNNVARLVRWEWRFYVHRPAEIVAVAESHGLRLAHEDSGTLWQVAKLER
ncbi:MAG: SAM-dependent methyltransferase [Gaiellaceae bacterium]